MTGKAASLEHQLASASNESRRSATNFQGRLTDFQRQVLQRTLEFERQKAALENQLKQQTATHEQERATLQRLLEAKTAESQALQEAVAKAVAERKDRLSQIQVFILSPLGESVARTVAAAVWDGTEQRGLIQVEGLAGPPPGQDYQLWIHDPKYPIPISGGLVRADQQGTVRRSFQPLFPIEKASRVTVSLEFKGGAEKPQGKVVLTSR
jgi:anti-sigma-K factor RskA